MSRKVFLMARAKTVLEVNSRAKANRRGRAAGMYAKRKSTEMTSRSANRNTDPIARAKAVLEMNGRAKATKTAK